MTSIRYMCVSMIIDEYLRCTARYMRPEKRCARPNEEGMPNVEEIRNNKSTTKPTKKVLESLLR